MDKEIVSLLIMGASKIVGEVIRYRPLSFGTQPVSSVRISAEAPGQEIVKKGVSTADTIAYQKDQLVKQITLMEMHLSQGCKINGKACDCCEKHPQVIEALAEETLGITGDPFYKEIIAWCQELKPRTTAEASTSGKYDAEYASMAQSGRRLRKMLMGSAVIPTSAAPAPVAEVTGLARKVSSGEMTREEALIRVKEIAQKYDKD
jgi:hypothetical protein